MQYILHVLTPVIVNYIVHSSFCYFSITYGKFFRKTSISYLLTYVFESGGKKCQFNRNFCVRAVSFQSMSCRIISTSHKEKPDLICSFLMILILLTLVSAQGKQMSFTNQAANVIKLDKMILQSNKALKDIKPKRPLEPIIFQRFCLKTKVYSMNCPE